MMDGLISRQANSHGEDTFLYTQREYVCNTGFPLYV
jgi:hypothetical protein